MQSLPYQTVKWQIDLKCTQGLGVQDRVFRLSECPTTEKNVLVDKSILLLFWDYQGVRFQHQGQAPWVSQKGQYKIWPCLHFFSPFRLTFGTETVSKAFSSDLQTYKLWNVTYPSDSNVLSVCGIDDDGEGLGLLEVFCKWLSVWEISTGVQEHLKGTWRLPLLSKLPNSNSCLSSLTWPTWTQGRITHSLCKIAWTWQKRWESCWEQKNWGRN